MLSVNPTVAPTSNLEYAIHYSGLGWEVFPAHTIKDSGCSCRKANCTSPGKHPRTQNGLKDATTDRSKILKWWNKNPDANIAIRTGIDSGLAVLDIDTKSNGFESLETLENTFDKLPESLTAVTGSKGNHILFAHPGTLIKTRSNIVEGIDFRGDGGYIIAPPSLHASGNKYYWLNLETKLLDMPEWLIELVNDKGKAPALQTIIPKGNRNSALMSIAGKMRSEGASQKALQTFLLEENQLKCEPPLPHGEVMGIIERVSSYQQGEKKFIYTWKKHFVESDLPSLSKLLLHALAYHMNSLGRSCYPTQEQLSVETSISLKTVRTHLEKCIESGYVERYLHTSNIQKNWNYGYIARLPDG
jgi:hypothetical protein